MDSALPNPGATSATTKADEPWVTNLALLWSNRRTLLRATAISFVLSAVIALLLPNQYQSSARIMPPEQTGSSAAMLAALAGKAGAPGGLLGMASGLLGTHGNGAIFISLLHSGTVAGHLIDRFQLQHVYRKRYVQDTAKKLARQTTVTEDTKSGVITIMVEDTSRERARDMAQAYVDELNAIVAKVNTSSARREREFIEKRLQSVQHDLQQAQLEMSDFSSKNTAVDIGAQTRAVVDEGAKLEAQLIAGELLCSVLHVTLVIDMLQLKAIDEMPGDGAAMQQADKDRAVPMRSEEAAGHAKEPAWRSCFSREGGKHGGTTARLLGGHDARGRLVLIRQAECNHGA